MLVAHLADIHIGHRQYGLDQRAEDYAHTFRRAIDKILELREEKDIDLVVIAGDLFDTTRPNPNAYVTVVDCLRRLAEAKLRVIVIRGNHEAPILNPVDNPLKVLASMRLVRYLETDYVDVGNVRLIGYGCTYSDLQNKLYSAISTMIDPNKVNVVLLHQYVEGTPCSYMMMNLDYYTISKKVVSKLLESSDTVFLCGHIHDHNVKHPELPVYYPGSLEIWDSREFETYCLRDSKLVKVREQATKGFLLVDISESSGKVRVTPVQVETSRRMVKVELEYEDVDPVTFKRDMTYLVENFDIPQAYLQIEVRGRLRRGYSSRDLQASTFRRLFKKAIRVDVKLDLEREHDRDIRKRTEAVSNVYYGIDTIIKRAIREVLKGDPDLDKIETLLIQLLGKVEEGDKGAVLSLLERHLGLTIRHEMDISTLLSGRRR